MAAKPRQMHVSDHRIHGLLPFQGGKLMWLDTSSMQLISMSKYGGTSVNRGNVLCNVAPSVSTVSDAEKVDFMKLQNGRVITADFPVTSGAVEGVEGEPVTLTEPVTRAIAAAFATWLLDKKKSDGPRRLKISIGHD